MNYEAVYQTLRTKLQELVPHAAVRLPNETPAGPTTLDIDVSVSEVDTNIYTEESTKRDISINLLLSVPVSTGTERINNIASRLATAFNPLHDGSFWTDTRDYFVQVQSVCQRQPNISENRYQINVRILAIIYT